MAFNITDFVNLQDHGYCLKSYYFFSNFLHTFRIKSQYVINFFFEFDYIFSFKILLIITIYKKRYSVLKPSEYYLKKSNIITLIETQHMWYITS